jgi:hypothetical protein
MTVAHYRIYELDPADQIMDGYSVIMPIGHRGAGDGPATVRRTVRLRSRCGRANGTLPASIP